MKFTQNFIIVILGIALLAQPYNCLRRGGSRSRSSRGARSMSNVARSAATMHTSKHRSNNKLSLKEIQTGKNLNDTCVIERINTESDFRTQYFKLPYCVNQMQNDCRFCHGQIYYSYIFGGIDCCRGILSSDGRCYSSIIYIRDNAGSLCDKTFYKLDNNRLCYLAYPMLLYFSYFMNVLITLMICMIVAFPGSLTYAGLVYNCR